MVIYEKSTHRLVIPEGIQEGQYTEEDIKQAYQDGYNDGNDEGYQDGYADGLDDGFDEGYQSGYTDGTETCQGEYGKELTFEIQSDGDIKWIALKSANTKTIEYKLNDGEWTSIISTTGGTTIPVVSGDTIQFRGNNISYADDAKYNYFGSICQFKVRGNIMSLIDSDDFANLETLTDNFVFSYLFRNCTGLTDASNLVLPATTLYYYCYWGMFSGCTNLTTAPELPATTLAEGCYSWMFQGCTSLTTAPTLPATTLVDYCYSGMFQNCTSLTTAPELPATTLADRCYYCMFNECTSLVNAPELPATTLTNGCYQYMFNNCTSLTQAPSILPATTLANDCYLQMFQNCTSLTTAPALPATTLANNCYGFMFNGCTSLVQAPELPATTLTNGCYQYMFSGCSSLNYIKCLATTNVDTTNCNGWASGVAATGTFVKNPNMTDWTTGIDGIPDNWTVQDAS